MYKLWHPKFLLFSIIVLGAIFSGCGYRFSVEGPGPVIGGEEKAIAEGPVVRLAIREFINRTFQNNLEFKYTNYMRQEFSVSSGAQVLNEEGQADFIMKGEIVSVNIPALTFSTAQTRESRVNVVVRVTVENRETGKIVWSETATGTGEFFVNQSSDNETGQDQLQFNQVLQDRALEQAGQQVAEILADDFWDARDQGAFGTSDSQPVSSISEQS